jgi:hypothetical protein
MSEDKFQIGWLVVHHEGQNWNAYYALRDKFPNPHLTFDCRLADHNPRAVVRGTTNYAEASQHSIKVAHLRQRPATVLSSEALVGWQ